MSEPVPMCRTCRHSVALDDQLQPGVVLWCERYSRPAEGACPAWEREPGADDE